MMKNQPICIELLNSFTDTELDNFHHFINCLYFNTDKSVIRLFEMLKKYILHKKFFDKDAQKVVYIKVFSSIHKQEGLEPKEKKHLNAKLSLLKKLSEQFLAIKELKEKRDHFNDLLLGKLLNRRQFRLFEKHIKQNELLIQAKKKDINFYRFRKILETHRMEYNLITSSIYKENNNFSELNYSTDNEYILLKIRYYITLLSSQRLTKVEYNASLIKEIDYIINFEGFKLNPPIIIGKATIDLIKYQEKKYYVYLLQLLKKYKEEITVEDLNYSYIIAINFCIQKMREGKMNYSDVFKLYEEMDYQNVLIEDEFVPIIKIKNYVTTASRVGEFVKAKKIIEKYRPFINKADRDNVCNYNYGVIAFYEQNYNEALKYFIRADLGQDTNLKVMILKCHYEMDTDYDERTMQIFRSAQKFFKDNKQLTTIRKRSYRNFIQVLIYIYKIKFNETKMLLNKAKEKLKAQDVNADREWLATKMIELKPVLDN